MSSIFKIFGSVACAVVLSSNASAQGLVSQKDIPLAMAKTIAEAAMDKCKELGFKVSVVVVDRAGLPLVMLRGDGAGLHTPEGADRKAYTARTFGTSSTDFVKRMLNDPASAGSKEYSRVLAISGGLPIKVGDDIVGAVGVSGSPSRHRQSGRGSEVKIWVRPRAETPQSPVWCLGSWEPYASALTTFVKRSATIPRRLRLAGVHAALGTVES